MSDIITKKDDHLSNSKKGIRICNELPLELQEIVDAYTRKWYWKHCISKYHDSPAWRNSSTLALRVYITNLSSLHNSYNHGDCCVPEISYVERCHYDLAYYIKYMIYLQLYPLDPKKPLPGCASKDNPNHRVKSVRNIIHNILYEVVDTWKHREHQIWNPLFGNAYAMCANKDYYSSFRSNTHDKKDHLTFMWVCIKNAYNSYMPSLCPRSLSKVYHVVDIPEDITYYMPSR